MKKFYLILLMMAVTLSASALSKSKSKRYSLYLSDKMAYELDLTDDQFEAVYQINYDYFRSIYDQLDIDMYWPERDMNMYYVHRLFLRPDHFGGKLMVTAGLHILY